MKRQMKRIFLIGLSFIAIGCNQNIKPKISCFNDVCLLSDKISEIEICKMENRNGEIYLDDCNIHEFK